MANQVPFSSILAKDTFLQSLALDNSINTVENDMNELLLINRLKSEILPSFPPPDPSFPPSTTSSPPSFPLSTTSSYPLPTPSFPIPTQENETKANFLNSTSFSHNSSTLYNEFYKHVPPRHTSQASQIFSQEFYKQFPTTSEGERKKREKSRGDIPFDEKAILVEIERLKEHVQSLEEANRKLHTKISTQELWASGQRKYVKDLVQQLKSKDEMVEDLKANLAKKQKLIDSLKTKTERTDTLHEHNQEWQVERKRLEQIHAQEMQALQEQIKEAKRRDNRTKDVQHIHKDQLAKKENEIEELRKENMAILQKLKKVEEANICLEKSLHKTKLQYSELSTFCQHLCLQASQMEQTHKEINEKILNLYEL